MQGGLLALCSIDRSQAESFVIRPFLYSMLRHNAVFSFTLALRSLASSAFIFTVWESAHVCFEVYATQVSRAHLRVLKKS